MGGFGEGEEKREKSIEDRKKEGKKKLRREFVLSLCRGLIECFLDEAGKNKTRFVYFGVVVGQAGCVCECLFGGLFRFGQVKPFLL